MRADVNDSNDPQDEEMERILRQVTPRGADAALRGRVLAAVGCGEAVGPVVPAGSIPPSRKSAGTAGPTNWERIYWPVAAAAILLGLVLNYWVAKTGSERLAQIMGPPAVSKQAADVAADIAAITDEATGRWAYDRLAASRRPPDPFGPSGMRAQHQ